MKELILNSSHKNGIVILYDYNNKIFIKSSSCHGYQNILNEMSGFTWYRKNNKSNILNETDYRIQKSNYNKYIRLFVKEYIGSKYSPYDPIEKNIKIIKKLISHYFTIWKKSEKQDLYPIHGDFSIGNCIIIRDEVIIFDWEHFNKNAAPFGFDVVNLYYENIFFTLSKQKKVSAIQIEHFKEIKNNLKKKLNKINDFEVDLLFLINFLNNNKSYWQKSFNKLPVINFVKKQIDLVYLLEL